MDRQTDRWVEGRTGRFSLAPDDSSAVTTPWLSQSVSHSTSRSCGRDLEAPLPTHIQWESDTLVALAPLTSEAHTAGAL